MAFQYLMASFSAPVGALVTLGGEIQEIEAGMVRLDDVLDYPTDPRPRRSTRAPTDRTASPAPAGCPAPSSCGTITFGYNPLGRR